MSENNLHVKITAPAKTAEERKVFADFIESLEEVVLAGFGESTEATEAEAKIFGMIESAKKHFAENPIEETVELPAHASCKVLSIGEVQESLVEANGRQAHISLLRHGIPDTFLRRAIEGFDDLGYDFILPAIKVFSALNPTASADVKAQFVIQTPTEG